MQPAIAQDEVVHLQFPYLHGAIGSRASDRAHTHQPRQTPPREGEVAAVVAEGYLGEEALGDGGLAWGVGRWVRRARALVLEVESFADRVAEVLRPLLRDLGEIPHALAVALGTAVAQLVRACQAESGGHPHVEPIVEALEARRQRLL